MKKNTKDNIQFWLKIIITLASAFLAALGSKAMGLSDVDSMCAGWLGSSAVRTMLK